MQTSDYREDVVTLFIIEKVTGNEIAAGDMPRGKQLGYLFSGATAQTIAHELGHGVFHLDHPFDRANAAKSFDRGDLVDNLMEYGNGTNLVKLQWDAIHAPGIVIGMFERDEYAIAINLQWIKEKIKEILKDLSLNTGQTMLTYIITDIYMDNYIDWNWSNWTKTDISDAMKAIKEYLKDNDGFKLMRKISEIISKHSINSDASQLMSITSMTWTENIQSQDVNTVASLTNKMITSNKDAATVIFGLLFEFKYGVGPETREFDAGSVLTKGVLDFYLVEEGREWFYKWRADLYFQSLRDNNERLLYNNPISLQNDEREVYKPTFSPIIGPLQAGLDLIKQYIGGFYMEFYPDEQGKQLEFVLYNAVNLKSLVGHYLYINELTDKNIFPEQYPRESGKITPLGEIIQILRWKENINNERFDKYKP
jgi:hypothetical protein